MRAKKTIKKTNKPAAKRGARSKSRPNRRIAPPQSTAAGGDTPNEAWLTIHVDSVEVNEGSSYMSFTASLWGNSVGFGTGTGQERRRILYDGPYQPPPYSISVSATERDPNSDDEFTDGVISLAIDLATLEGSASTTISQVPGDKDDNDAGDDAEDPDDPDETASYIVTCSGQITPAVEMSADEPIDWDQKNAPDGTKVIHWLEELPEGGCGDRTHKALDRLTENLSLARGKNNAKRFPCWSQWRLSTDPGVIFQIQDAGDFITENRLDRYAGLTGPDPSANVSFKMAYVYRV